MSLDITPSSLDGLSLSSLPFKPSSVASPKNNSYQANNNNSTQQLSNVNFQFMKKKKSFDEDFYVDAILTSKGKSNSGMCKGITAKSNLAKKFQQLTYMLQE